jgi:uncharacterized membrane protein
MNTFIAFYTIKTPYEEIVKTYEASLQSFHLPYKLYPIISTNSWYKDCQEKPKIILRALNEFPKSNIVYSDADSEIVQYPSLFDSIDADFAYYYNKDRQEVLSGTLFIKNNDSSKQLLQQ